MRRLACCLLVTVLLYAPAFASPSAKSHVDPGKVRRELRQILSAPEYDHTVRTNAFDRFVTKIGRAIWDAGARALKWLADRLTFEDSSFGKIASTVGSWLVLAGFLVLVWYIAKKLIANYGGKGPAGDDTGVVNYDMPSAKPLMKQAAKLAEQGDYRGAFRAAYVACIAYLDEIRALRFERSRTNWEYLRELQQGGHEKPYGELHPLTLDFDRKIYGRETCEQEDYQNVAAAYQRISSEEAK